MVKRKWKININLKIKKGKSKMNKKKIGIIFGGCSPEYDVSLESAYSVITNINKEKYTIKSGDKKFSIM